MMEMLQQYEDAGWKIEPVTTEFNTEGMRFTSPDGENSFDVEGTTDEEIDWTEVDSLASEDEEDEA